MAAPRWSALVQGRSKPDLPATSENRKYETKGPTVGFTLRVASAEMGPGDPRGRSTRICPLCGNRPRLVAPLRSPFSGVTFQLGMCDACQLGLVLDSRTDLDVLYGPDYYTGKGADPLVDYERDEQPGSIREIEWNGIVRTVSAIVRRRQPVVQSWRLLDWGAGLGGLVRAARRCGIEADGLDEGYAATVLAEKGLMAMPEPERRGRYDVITAIEVVEHLIDPLSVLRSMAICLKPGGFLFITTGNLSKARGPLDRWYYAQIPDVHVTFWSPRSWTIPLRKQAWRRLSFRSAASIRASSSTR